VQLRGLLTSETTRVKSRCGFKLQQVTQTIPSFLGGPSKTDLCLCYLLGC